MRIETEAEEVARLKKWDKGSRFRGLARLPVTFPDYPEGHILELPRYTGRGDSKGLATNRIVVVAIALRQLPQDKKVHCFTGQWECLVVGGDDPIFTQGTTIPVSESELRRSTPVEV